MRVKKKQKFKLKKENMKIASSAVHKMISSLFFGFGLNFNEVLINLILEHINLKNG